MQPGKIGEFDKPVNVFTALTQVELSENVACRAIMYPFSGFQSPATISLSLLGVQFTAVVELIPLTTIGPENWCVGRSRGRIDGLALRARYSNF